MKKTALVILLLSLVCVSVWCLDTPEYYDSSYMLDHFFHLDGNQGFEESYLENTKISILFVDSGDVLYQWFGHLGVLVETKDSPAVLYDYGRFEFGPGFYLNFAMGRLWYKCVASYAFYELSVAAQSDRGVYVKTLDLTNEEKAAVLVFLNTNSSKEYNTYLYHNYKDNCSTRIRDLFDRLTKGSFKAEMESRPGRTYREMANMVLSRNIPVLWVLDFLQGRNIDMEQTYWDQMFLPVVFFDAIEGQSEQIIRSENPDARPSIASEPVPYIFKAAVASFALGLLQLAFVYMRRKNAFFRITGTVYTFVLHLFLGVLGTILFFMMFFTLHDYTFLNENILFLNPAMLVLSFLTLKPLKHKKALRTAYGVFISVILVLILLKLILPALLIQNNWPQIVFMLFFYTFNFVAICCVRE